MNPYHLPLKDIQPKPFDKLNMRNHTIFDYQILERVLLELGIGHPINSSPVRI